jgi:hypothetical protein
LRRWRIGSALPEREAGSLIEALRRLGIGTLGELAALSPSHVADRFGPPGLRALRLARGEDELLACSVHGSWEALIEEIELPEGTTGSRLERALELLVERLLAAPRRQGRTLLGIRLGATLGDGGSWSVAQGLGRTDRVGTSPARSAPAAAGAAAGARRLTPRCARSASAPAPPSRWSFRCGGTSRAAAASVPPCARSVRPGGRLAAQGAADRRRLSLPRATGHAHPLPGFEPMTPGSRRLYAPSRVAVEVDSEGVPRAVEGGRG